MFKELTIEVCRGNKALVDSGLVILTWGNVSGVDRKAGAMAIKPSGVLYDKLTPEDIVEANTDTVIEDCFKQRGVSADDVPGVLPHGHAPFTWKATPQKALDNSIALEACYKTAK